MDERQFQTFIEDKKKTFKPSTTKQQFEENLEVAQEAEQYVAESLSMKYYPNYVFSRLRYGFNNLNDVDIVVHDYEANDVAIADVKVNTTVFRLCKEKAGWDPKYNIVLNDCAVDDYLSIGLPVYLYVYIDNCVAKKGWYSFRLTKEIADSAYIQESKWTNGRTHKKLNINMLNIPNLKFGETITDMKKIKIQCT